MASAQRVIFVNRFYAPDYSATAQILTSLCEDLAAHGMPVEVFTSRLRYGQQDGEPLPKREQRNDVTVRRIWTSHFGRGSLPGRALDYLTFYISLAFTLVWELRRDDVVVAKTDPPMVSVLIAAIARIKRARMVNWLQDMFPEVASAAGVLREQSLLWRVCMAMKNWSLRAAHANVVIGERMAERVRHTRVPDEDIVVIPNWSLMAHSGQAIPHAQNTLRQQWQLDAFFVVGYSGNLGMAHDCDLMLATIRAMAPFSHIRFLLIGGGAGMEHIREAAQSEGLKNVVFQPYQPLECLAESLSVADLHWVSLKPEMEGLIVPSKLYGVLAVHRPVLFVGARDGEVARIIRNTGCGWVVAEQDVSSVQTAIEQACASTLSPAVFEAAYQQFSPAVSKQRWRDLLAQV